MLVIPEKKRRKRSPTETKYVTAVFGEENLNNQLSSDRLFRNLSPALQEKLCSISIPATYRKGHLLFAEGQLPRGVFLIEQGRVRLAAESSDGKSLLLHIAVPGEILGLPATVSGKRYEITAEATETTQVNFIPRNSFLQWVDLNREAGLRVAEVLSEIYYATYRELRYLGLATSAEARLARFLLVKTSNHNSHNGHAGATGISMTHQEIAAVIGLSRETVTRLLSEFKRRGLVNPQNSHLTIGNAAGLLELLA
jgi:CRP/FNR family transcriptional regulator, cyclic AMP receptor protein